MAKIINFHDIYDPQWFEDTLQVIMEKYEIVPFSEIENFYSGKTKSQHIAHLTVDDGHISTYTLIYPILKKLGLTASIFVSPLITEQQTNFWYSESGDYDPTDLKHCIAEVLQIASEKLDGLYPRSVMKMLTLEQNWQIIHLYQEQYKIAPKKCQYINTTQLLELENSGIFTIGAHTNNHPILANETKAISDYEIKDSLEKLGNLLGRKVTTFAYPNGSKDLDFGRREMQALKDAEVDYAFSFEFKNLRKNDNLLSIPRFGLYHGNKDFVRKKLKYGALWEPIKKKLLNTEEKHRLLIKKRLSLK